MSTFQSLRGYLLLSCVLIILDQATKMQITAVFAYGERLPLIPGLLDFTLAHNTGAAFSFLASSGGWQRWFFVVLALAASGLLLNWMKQQVEHRVLCIALAMILAGAIGNLIDRMQHGYVVDFILVYWQESWYFPVFNIADIAITCGAILLAIDELVRWNRQRQQQTTRNS